MTVNTAFLRRCIVTLRFAFVELGKINSADPRYDIYRAACVKEFELIVELTGMLLRKHLRPFFAADRKADRVVYKDVFRYATKYSQLDTNTCERWLSYQDRRNDSVHDYGEDFADAVPTVLPEFISDASSLVSMIEEGVDG